MVIIYTDANAFCYLIALYLCQCDTGASSFIKCTPWSNDLSVSNQSSSSNKSTPIAVINKAQVKTYRIYLDVLFVWFNIYLDPIYSDVIFIAWQTRNCAAYADFHLKKMLVAKCFVWGIQCSRENINLQNFNLIHTKNLIWKLEWTSECIWSNQQK